MKTRRRDSVAELKRRLFKYNLVSMAATAVIALAIYSLATGRGGEIHPWLADQSRMLDLLVAAGVVELLVMMRISRIKRLKQGVLNRRPVTRARA
ncbi:hypothetical protein H9C73_06355 [Marinobacterium sp. AK62]|uniref:Uncharacterized protein n=1 Tax=Marinobacterium alkalitolerans TaxID=1542925 RepID=A0ABS3Z9G6_9GAMM|nr:hypothetical protein [Marinobacterium alkalitolerans]MBP0048352.1 hypothetical protein [Marinobacterium alkalitolerans]